MAYNYVLLTEEEKDDITVSFLKSQERDMYCHEVNIERYNTMLPTLPEGDFKKRIQHLLNDENKRKTEIESIIVATVPKLPSKERVAAAKIRLEQKEKVI